MYKCFYRGKRTRKNKKGTNYEKKTEPPKPITFSTILSVASKDVSTSTVDNYHIAIRSFLRFNGGKKIALSGIDCRLVTRYERWLREQGVCPNTSSCYLRSLRAIYNKAVAKRQIKDKKPFRNAFTGNDRTVKRSIDVADIRKLQSLELPDGSRQALVRDLFLFSFYAMGMPFIDLAMLKWIQIKGDTLTYCRQKIGRQVVVKLEPCMKEIIKKHGVNNSLFVFPLQCGKSFVANYPTVSSLPIVSSTLKNYKLLSLRGYNRILHFLAQKASIKSHLSSYVPRHSWASMAYRHHIDLHVISRTLGHSDSRTTLIYIRSIDDQQVARANKKLLWGILVPSLGKRWNQPCN